MREAPKGAKQTPETWAACLLVTVVICTWRERVCEKEPVALTRIPFAGNTFGWRAFITMILRCAAAMRAEAQCALQALYSLDHMLRPPPSPNHGKST